MGCDFFTRFGTQFKRFVIVFTKYCVVGVINTFVSVLIMIGLKFLGTSYFVYTVIAYICGIFVSFCLNFKLTFAVKGKVKKRFMSFIWVNSINLIIVEFLQLLFINFFAFKEVFAVGVGMVFYVIFGFLMNQKFVFHDKSNSCCN